MPGRVVIFVTRGDETALRLAGACALTAASMDQRVDVFLFGPALSAVVEGVGDADSPVAVLQRARAEASCRVLACSASVVAERLAPPRVEPAVDAVVGWPTILEWSHGVVDRFFF